MSMKKTDLEKLKGKKLAAGGPGTPDRFGKGSGKHAGRGKGGGKQRDAVPLAVKLLKGLGDK
jgi:hypothetical protein